MQDVKPPLSVQLFLRVVIYFGLCLLCTVRLVTSANAADQPNIVWIISEDNSIHYLDHFFRGGARAPHIEALAKEGLTFNHAFSNAPVCSVARTTLITGCYGPRIGTQYHRRYAMAAMPEGLQMFPAYLRDAGYYTTNNSKKDYNAVEGRGVWDASSGTASWRNRSRSDQPFFHMQSHPQSHEGTLHFKQDSYELETTSHDPTEIQLADYHPDTKLFRYTHARYLDRMLDIDAIVQNTVEQLTHDGLLEDTFIFYFGDHGGVLPRSKGYIYESGLHVPLVIRVPKNFKHLAPVADGTRLDGFVSFIDFGPTVLHLAGVDVPNQVDGKPFLGRDIAEDVINQRQETFGYADRFDEKYDFIRSIRRGKYQYIRNYQPYLPDGLNNNYRYKNLAYSEWRSLFQEGQLEGPPSQFFSAKPVEMLFDCELDPHQVVNLATNPQYQQELLELRQRLQVMVKALPDLSFYPESYLTTHAMKNPVEFGKQHQQEISELVDIADLTFISFQSAKPKLDAALSSSNAMKRYWAAMTCAAIGKEAAELTTAVEPLLEDPVLMVRVRAAEFLGRIGAINPQPTLIEVVNTTTNSVEATEALNAVVWFKDFFKEQYAVRRSDFHPKSDGADIAARLNYINGIPYPPKSPKTKKRKNKKVNDS